MVWRVDNFACLHNRATYGPLKFGNRSLTFAKYFRNFWHLTRTQKGKDITLLLHYLI